MSMSCICEEFFSYLERTLKHVYQALQVNSPWTLGLKLVIFNPEDKVEHLQKRVQKFPRNSKAQSAQFDACYFI